MAAAMYAGADVNLRHAGRVTAEARHSYLDPETLFIGFNTDAGAFELTVSGATEAVQRQLYDALGDLLGVGHQHFAGDS